MGKLHTIRRAIKRAPDKWYTIADDGTLRIMGARFIRRTGQWVPITYMWSGVYPYKNFVGHVVQEILNECERRKNNPR